MVRRFAEEINLENIGFNKMKAVSSLQSASVFNLLTNLHSTRANASTLHPEPWCVAFLQDKGSADHTGC